MSGGDTVAAVGGKYGRNGSQGRRGLANNSPTQGYTLAEFMRERRDPAFQAELERARAASAAAPVAVKRAPTRQRNPRPSRHGSREAAREAKAEARRVWMRGKRKRLTAARRAAKAARAAGAPGECPKARHLDSRQQGTSTRVERGAA
jgi:hypothetical protein